jgi:hypothetical protein
MLMRKLCADAAAIYVTAVNVIVCCIKIQGVWYSW